MDAPQDKNNIDSNVQDYINELGSLLQKKRNKEKTDKVNDLLKSNLTVRDKIRRIKEIDEVTTYGPPDHSKENVEDYRDLLKKENIIDSQEAKRFREIIKAPYFRNTLFHFLFREFRQIKEFSKKYDVIYCYLFPPKIKVNKGLLKSFIPRLQKDAAEAANCMKLILKEGWQYLTKKEYNQIYFFNELCKKIVSTSFGLLNYKDDNLIDRIRSIEALFLTCNHREYYLENIRNSIRIVVEKNPDWKMDSGYVNNLVTNILVEKEVNPSLATFITGLNIIKYRKFLKFRDLFLTGSFNVISNFDYECEDNIKKRIKTQIDDNLKNLIEHMKQKDEIDKIKNYISYQKDGIDFARLSNFYESENEKRNYNFNADKENVLEFVQRFFNTFLIVFEDLLADTVKIDSLHDVKIFTNDYFQYEIDRMKYLLKKIHKYNYSCPNFPYARFVELKVTKKGGTTVETEMLQIIYDFVQTLQSLANKLTEVDRFHNENIPEEIKIKNEILSLATVLRKNFIIPYHDKKIVSPTILNDMTIKHAMSYIIGLCYLFNILLYDKSIPNLLERESNIKSAVRVEKEIIEKLTTIIEFKKIKEKYKFW